MITEFNEFDEFSMKLERLVAYQLMLRKMRFDSEDFKKKVIVEIEVIQNEDIVLN